MATQAVQVVLSDGKNVREKVSVTQGAKHAPAKIKAIPDGKFILIDKETGHAPENVTVRRVGKNLFVSLEGDSLDDPSLIIEDFFEYNSELIGMSASGAYYAYVTTDSDDDKAGLVALADGESSALALGGEPLGSYDAGGVFAIFPWLAAAGVLAFGAAAAVAASSGSSSGGGDKVETPPPAVKPDPVVPEKARGVDQVIDNQGPIQGALEKGDVTDDRTPTFNGHGEPGSTIIIRDGDQEIGRVEIGDDGTWTFTPETPLNDGSHSITVIEQDKDGNQSAPSDPWEVVVDTQKPDVPTIGGVEDDVGAIKGPLQPGDSTDDKTPTFTGTGEPGATVIIRDGGKEIGRAEIDSDGNWTFTPKNELADGPHSITVIVQDPAGNQSEPSGAWDLTVDTVNPGKPTVGGVEDDYGDSTGPLQPGDSTDDRTPTFSGTGEPGATVIIRDGEKELGRAEIDGKGNWTYTPQQKLDDGPHSITVIVQDSAGNQSEPSDAWDLTIADDKVILPELKAKPIVGGVEDNVGPITGPLQPGDHTDDKTPTISGSGDPGDTVIIRDGETEIGRTEIDENGKWTFTPKDGLDDGSHSINVIVKGPDGSTSVPSESWELVVDTEKPAKPTIGGVEDDVGLITGPLQPGDSTDDKNPTFTGTGEPGATVIIRDGEKELGRAEIDGNGNWTFTPKDELDDGAHAINVIVQDLAGNQSEPSDTWDLTVDTQSPNKPVIGGIEDNFGDHTGPLQPGDSTDDKTPTFSGSGEPGDTVIILDGDKELGRTEIGEDGNWTFTPKDELDDGSHSITVIVQDPAGNQSEPSDPWDLTVDTKNPGVPTIEGMEDAVGDKTGPILRGDVTDDSRPTISGTSEAGSTVIVYDKGVKIGETKADAAGVWSFRPELSLGAGSHEITVQARDDAGNLSERSSVYDFTLIGAGAPASPAIISVTDDVGPITGELQKGDRTDDARPTLRGSGEPGSVITIFSNGEVLGTTTVGSNGQWEFTPDHDLAEGLNNLTASAKNAAGNESAKTGDFAIEVDVTAPEGVKAGVLFDDVGAITGPIVNGTTTDDSRPTFSGEAEPYATIVIYDGENEIARVRADADGAWTYTPATALEDGEHSLAAQVIDRAGNASEIGEAITFTVDTRSVQISIDAVFDDFGVITGAILPGGVTDDATPTLSGRATPNAVVVIYDNNVEIGRAQSDASGNWRFTPEDAMALAEGAHSLHATVVTEAGGESAPTPSFDFQLDKTAPDMEGNGHGINAAMDDVGRIQGQIENGGYTDDTTPTFEGTGVPGDTVFIYDHGDTLLGSVVVGTGGDWSFTPQPLIDGEHQITVVMQDPAGNRSKPSEPWVVNVDTDVPNAPSLDAVMDDVGDFTGELASGAYTDDSKPTFSGTGEPGATAIIRDGANEIGRVQIDDEGNWTFTPEQALQDGPHSINVIVQDKAGNQSAPSDAWDLIVDTVAPGKPTIGGAEDNVGVITGALESGDQTDDTRPTFNGTGEPGTTVIIRDGQTEIGRAPIGEDGTWTYTPADALADGEHSISVIVQDQAGNKSDPSDAWVVNVDTGRPDQPTIDGAYDNVGDITGELVSGALTDDKTPTFRGTGEPGATAIIRDGQTELGRVEIDADGNWSYTPGVELADGPHSINVIVQDPAGNQSVPSQSWDLTIVDSGLPNTPVITGILDDVGAITGALVSGDHTDDTRPTISGTGEPGATAIIRDGQTELGRVQIDGAGNWEFTPSTDLADGAHSISVVVRNPAGNVSAPSAAWELTVDTGAPSKPSIDAAQDDVGAITGPLASGDVTDDAKPTFSGTGEPGATVIIRDGQTEIGRAPIGEDGAWTYTPGADLGDGEHAISVVVQDQAGNQSSPSDPWIVNVDTTKPAQPSIDSLYDDVGDVTGTLVSGAQTDDTRPTLGGKGEAGSTIIVLDHGNEIGRAVADADGAWSFTPDTDLGQGEHSFTVISVDRAGNASDESSAWVAVIVVGNLSQPSIDLVEDDFGSQIGALHSGDVTDDATPTISGRSEPNTTVYIYNHGTEIGVAQADATGNWSFTPSQELSDDVYSFTAVAANAAGVRSPASDPFDLVIYSGTGPDKVAYLSHMGKDSGYDGNDFVTDNGSAGRLMYGLLSAELKGSEQVEVSTDGGKTWVKARTEGLNWAAQDNNSHLSNWAIQTRVVAAAGGEAGYVMQQAVSLDLIAPRSPSSIDLNGSHLTVGFVSENLVVGDRISVVADGGLHRFEYTLTQADLNAGSVTLDVGNVSSASAALVDHAGNLSTYANTAGVPSVNIMVTGDVTEIYGQSRDNVFSIEDVSILDHISVIEGNGGVDTLRLLGADQTLDLSAIKGRLSSIEVIDLTGSGNNTLKVSLGDVLDIGNRGSFINDQTVQLAVKGNAGDMVVLSDLLPNGMHTGDWEMLGHVTSAGVVYDVYRSNFDAELLVQQGVSVTF